jgi:drug/metabolite transporter (DMT)-like permease
VRDSSNATVAATKTQAALDPGLVLGLVAVFAFSLSTPTARVSAVELGATFVAFGRALIAACLGGAYLRYHRVPFPPRRAWPGLAIVIGGTVVGFPLFSCLAIEHVPSVHAAIFMGLTPAFTAIAAVVRAGERPRPWFWVASALGVGAVVVFAIGEGAGTPRPADLWLLLAVVLVGFGYAEGGRLARELGGLAVLSWSVVLAAPIVAAPAVIAAARHGLAASPQAWLGFCYQGTVSMFLGFIAWYRAMAVGGIARVGQLQLIQPVLSVGWGALLLGEPISAGTVLAGGLVIASAALVRRFR